MRALRAPEHFARWQQPSSNSRPAARPGGCILARDCYVAVTTAQASPSSTPQPGARAGTKLRCIATSSAAVTSPAEERSSMEQEAAEVQQEHQQEQHSIGATASRASRALAGPRSLRAGATARAAAAAAAVEAAAAAAPARCAGMRLDGNTATKQAVLVSAAATAATYVLQLLHALAAPPWQGLVSDLFSFGTLVAVFIEHEKEAALCCWLAACGSALLLVSTGSCQQQPASTSGAAPQLVLVAAAAAFAAASAVYAFKLRSDWHAAAARHLHPGQRPQPGLCLPDTLWKRWQQALGVAGGGLLLCFAPAHVAGTELPAGQLLVAGSVAALSCYCITSRSMFLQLLRARRGPTRARLMRAAARVPAAAVATLQALRMDLPFWCATLLLISQPLGAALALLQDPVAGLLQLDATPIFLAALCNALLVPRAWHNADFMMFTGTCSCALLGALQLLLTLCCASWLQRCEAAVQAGAVAAGIAVAFGLVRAGQLKILERRDMAAGG